MSYYLYFIKWSGCILQTLDRYPHVCSPVQFYKSCIKNHGLIVLYLLSCGKIKLEHVCLLEWWETQRVRLLLYRWMIVNDIHIHPVHCSSAVNNKTPFHYILACSLGLGGIWLPTHLSHNLLSLEDETCLIGFWTRLFKSRAELGQGKPWTKVSIQIKFPQLPILLNSFQL